MSHHAAHLHLTEFALGQLDETTSDGVQAHVSACAECRADLHFVEVLRDALRARAREILIEHPDGEALAQLALDDPQLELSTRAALGAHLRGCAVCRSAVEAARASDRRSAWGRIRSWTPRSKRGRGSSAIIAVVGLSLAAWMLFPRSAQEPLVSVGASVVLEGTTRAGSSPARLVLPAEAGTVLLLVREDPWNARENDADFVVRITLQSDGSSWVHTVPASQLWIESTGFTQILVPRSVFAAGTARLRLEAVDTAAVLHESNFEVTER